jgi:hypothetical protein
MSYYSRSHHNTDTSWWTILICLVLALLLIFISQACTAQEWNNGKCPKCNVRYELRGVYKGTYYYACPDCGNEVSRFGGK